MNGYIIIALYWIVCCISVYVFRNKNGKASLHIIAKQETKYWEHLLIVLLCLVLE